MAVDGGIGVCCGWLGDALKGVFNYIRKYDELVESLEPKVKDLEARLSTIVKRVDYARVELRLVIREDVTLWINNASKGCEDARKFLKTTEKNDNKKCFGRDCNCCRRYWGAKAATKHSEDIQTLFGDGVFDPVYESELNPEPMAEFWEDGYVGLTSRNTTIEQLKGFLQVGAGGNEKLVVGIYGVEGVGKAAVAKKLAAEMESPELKVAISEGKTKEAIQMEIAERVGLKLIIWTVRERAQRLFEKLKRTNVLIIFVNVDHPIDLEDIGIPKPALDNHCRIMVVSTSADVCKAMYSQVTLKIEPLIPEETEIFAAALAVKYNWSNYTLDAIPSGKKGLPAEIEKVIRTQTTPTSKPIVSPSTGGGIIASPSSGGEITAPPSSRGGINTILLDAKALQIEHVKNSEYWRLDLTKSSPEAVLKQVWYLHIEGKSKGLLPGTNYGAYFVYELPNYAQGFKRKSVELIVGASSKFVNLDPLKSISDKPTKRADNWLEIEMGRFYSNDFVYSPVKLVVQDHDVSIKKTGLRIYGIELRQLDQS